MRVTDEKLLNISNRATELVEFLNLDFRKLPKFTSEQVEVFWYAHVASKNPKLAEKVQKDLRLILTPLTNPRKRPTPEQAQRLMARLIRRANQVGFKATWSPFYRIEYDPNMKKDVVLGKMPGFSRGRVFRLRGEDAWGKAVLPINEESVMWIPVSTAAGKSEKVGWYVRSTISSPKIEEQIYYEVVRLLENGELPLLRSCPECQRFFVAVDPRRDFCSDHCRHTYNNRPRLESGYFSKLRHKKRERNIQEARKLLSEGKTLDAVMKETQLSARILERAGLIE
jgi:hypothetical protein